MPVPKSLPKSRIPYPEIPVIATEKQSDQRPECRDRIHDATLMSQNQREMAQIYAAQPVAGLDQRLGVRPSGESCDIAACEYKAEIMFSRIFSRRFEVAP